MNNTTETANPVIDTARLTISQLAAAGIREASDLADMFGFKEFMNNYRITGDTVYPLAVIQEARYGFINRYVENSGIANIMDLGCGFSPRGLVMARKGLHYLGCDLESAVDAMSGIVRRVSESEKLPGQFGYRLTDITNPSAMIEAARTMSGEILMCCEGLLIYLGVYEFDSMLGGISSVLHEHGGCFITPDLVTAKFMAGILTAVLGKEEGMKALLSIGRSISEKSDTQFTGSLTRMPEAQMQALFEKHDLACEFIPFLSEDAELSSFEKLTDEQVNRLKENLTDIKCLKLTAAGKTVHNYSLTSDKFSAEISCRDGSMYICLTGRLDSVSAPALLDEYRKASAERNAENITIDASKLEYISSAGLRTLLIMQKELKANKVHIVGAAETIRDILDQTGFSDILEVD